MENNKLILAIDFDGTIVEIDYPDIGELKESAVEYINKLYDDGHQIIINSCRVGNQEVEMCWFLHGQGIKHHYVNENHPAMIDYYGTDTRKISADLYIDDKNLGGLPEWKDIYKLVQEHAKALNR